MRKKILFAAVAVAALTACSNDDVVDVNKGNGISFRTSMDKPLTRAKVINKENLEVFKVTAIGNGANYFTNLDVKSDDQGENWKTASTYYWPDYKLDFFAYAPTTVSNVSIGNTEKKIIGFSPKQEVNTQEDLVISYNTGTKEANTNGVAMNFKHALSQIEVQAKCLNEKIKVEVLGVKLENAAATADFIFPEEETGVAYSLQKEKWSNPSGLNEHGKAYMIKGENSITLGKDPQSIMFGDNNFMLIPQQLTGWNSTAEKTGAYLSVLCCISSLDGLNETQIYPKPGAGGKKYAFSAVSISTLWEPGKKYTYTLTFAGEGGGGGRIDPNPTGPTEPVDPVIDPNPGQGGDTILGNPIKFTVAVDDWMDKLENVPM